MSDMRLCYVDGCWAWFTSQPLDKQWGDDWNDAPYEHNSEEPYGPCWHNEPEQVRKRGGSLCDCEPCRRDWNDDGTPRWTLERLAWTGPFEAPCDGHLNSPYSVQQINAGLVPWLRTYDGHLPLVTIPAGVTIDEFVRLVQKAGGDVWGRLPNE